MSREPRPKHGLSLHCLGGKELEQVDVPALGEERPLCAVHIVGIVPCPPVLAPGLPRSAAKVGGSVSHPHVRAASLRATDFSNSSQSCSLTLPIFLPSSLCYVKEGKK